MMGDMSAGFYWARRRDGGALTVIEVTTSLAGAGGADWIQMIGNLNVMDPEEATEYFEILERIKTPDEHAAEDDAYDFVQHCV